MQRLIAAVIVAGACLLVASGRADAYPQFQFTSGTNRCSQCHYSPAGGGLITQWGRDESGDTISLGGDGNLLHGAWSPPSWLAIGGDFRFAGTYSDDKGQESPRMALFPMQADIYLRFAFGQSISLYLTGGARGEVRPEDDSVGGRFTALPDHFISREHYLMWRPSATGPYARVGRFYAPYGLRFVEHIYFVRRYTGYELYAETYTASGGYVSDDWELHVSAFTPPPSGFPDQLQAVGARESGGAAYYEKRLGGMAALAAQGRAGVGSAVSRYQGGLVGKLWIEEAKVLLLGEADFIRQQVSGVSYGQNQFVSYAGATFVPVRGTMAALFYERFQEDLSVKATGRNAYNLQINFFPWAHFEVMGILRYQAIAGPNNPSYWLGMLQVHYYL
jgi:hypothetical protein